MSSGFFYRINYITIGLLIAAAWESQYESCDITAPVSRRLVHWRNGGSLLFRFSKKFRLRVEKDVAKMAQLCNGDAEPSGTVSALSTGYETINDLAETRAVLVTFVGLTVTDADKLTLRTAKHLIEFKKILNKGEGEGAFPKLIKPKGEEIKSAMAKMFGKSSG